MKKILINVLIMFLPIYFVGCEDAQIEGSGHGSEVTPGGGDGSGSGYDPDIEDPLPELPELEEVEDVCTKMDDLQFMEYCYTNFDVNGDSKVSMSEANAVQEIVCNTAASFTGIGYFSNLREFRSTSVKSVNLGYNKGLISLDCSGSPVKVLDLRYNTQLSDIDVSQCTGLTSVTFPDGLTGIGSSAFDGCTGLTSVTFPDGLTGIGAYAFRGCTGLTSVTFPDGLTEIGYCAFYGCTGLTSVTFPDGLPEIGSSAFYGCTGLTSVTFPDGLTEIGGSAFEGCTGLTSVTFNSDVSINGYAFKDAPCKFYGYGVVLDNMMYAPDGVLRAVSDLMKNTKVNIPSGITAIGYRAFIGCTGLTFVTFPDGLTEIGDEAFRDCTGLTSVTFPDGLTGIGQSAFLGCTGLTSVTFPDGLIEIGYCAFSGCTGLTTVDASRCQLEFQQEYPHNYQFMNCRNLKLFSIGNIVPPKIDMKIFYNALADNPTLKVPAESVDAYKASYYWAYYFDNIVPLD